MLIGTDYRKVAQRVDYAISGFGRSLAEALMPRCAWGNAHRERIARMPRLALVAADS
jgi:DNA-binding HxlR family transcriptional regulator